MSPEAPAPLPHVDDEQHSGEERDEEQELDRRQLRVDVRVRRAVDDATRRRRQLVLLEPVARRLEQGEEGEQHGEVELHLGRDPPALHLEPDAPVEVVGHGGDDEDDHRGGEHAH